MTPSAASGDLSAAGPGSVEVADGDRVIVRSVPFSSGCSDVEVRCRAAAAIDCGAGRFGQELPPFASRCGLGIPSGICRVVGTAGEIHQCRGDREHCYPMFAGRGNQLLQRRICMASAKADEYALGGIEDAPAQPCSDRAAGTTP